MAGIVRGCGSRQKSGIYLEVLSSPWGMPIEHFLFCPPIRIDQETFGLSNIGVKIVQYETGNHVMDIVGESFYPNVADVIEEGKRFGFSRRVPKTLNFELLTPESRLMLLHHRAWIENHAEYNRQRDYLGCPKDLAEHENCAIVEKSDMCASLFWEDIEGATLKPEPLGDRMVMRKMPAFEYRGSRRPDGVTPVYSLAMLGGFPIGRIAVIDDPDGGTHEDSVKRAKASSLPVEVVES